MCYYQTREQYGNSFLRFIVIFLIAIKSWFITIFLGLGGYSDRLAILQKTQFV
jgi:uncharacterized membrane protein